MTLGIRPYRSEDLSEIVEQSSRAGTPSGATLVHEVLTLVDNENALVLVVEREREILGPVSQRYRARWAGSTPSPPNSLKLRQSSPA